MKLVMAKLECCGLDKPNVLFMLDYLTNRKQRAKIVSAFST